jgi:hypothetical protein
VSKETYYNVKRDLLQCQTSCVAPPACEWQILENSVPIIFNYAMSLCGVLLQILACLRVTR